GGGGRRRGGGGGGRRPGPGDTAPRGGAPPGAREPAEARDRGGRRVGGRVAVLEEELPDAGRARPAPAGAGMLRHDEATVRLDLGDRIPDVEGRDLSPVGEVPARRLRAALEDVSGDGAGGAAIPVVPGPAQLVPEPAQRQRR